jgi:DNA repair exonuclease SbcCD ATPase subunit
VWQATIEKLRGAAELAEAKITELEGLRQEARQRLAASDGMDAEALAGALKQLDDRLVEARESRATLQTKMRTAERMAALVAEAQALKPEMDRLSEAGDDGPRYQELRARALEIKAEFAKLENDPAS